MEDHPADMETHFDVDLLAYQAKSGVLDGRVIMITGAGAGIGKATSIECARLGATVILVDKVIGKLESIYDEIIASGGPEPAIYPIDLSGATQEHYRSMAETLAGEFGRLDGLINNAGWLGAYVPFEHYDMKLYHDVMMINLHAPFMLTQALLPLLKKSPDPAVVFSTHYHSLPFAGAFGIAKAGLEAMMQILALEYDTVEDSIRFNGVDAGTVDTEMRRLSYPAENWSKNTSPEKVVPPYIFFVGPDSKRITGINFRVQPQQG